MFIPSLVLPLCFESVAKDYNRRASLQLLRAVTQLHLYRVPPPSPSQLPAQFSLGGSDLQSSFGVTSFRSYGLQQSAAQPMTRAIKLTTKAL